MQQLLQQNNRLRQIMQKCQQQIIQLRKIGQQHEQQIDNLLKFNQRLLSIIQTQMPNKTISRSPSGGNLQPIDQAAGDKEQQLGVGGSNSGNNGNNSNGNNGNISNSNNLIGLVNNHRFVNMQLEKQHAIKERVEHLEQEQVEHLSQQQNNYTHHHLNNDNNNQNEQQEQHHQQNHINNINKIPINVNNKKQLKFINTQSYSPRTNNQQQQQQQNRYNNNYQQQQQQQQHQYDQQQYQEERDNVIYRQEKQSLIDIPKFFKLQKGLNQHYHKELFHSMEENYNNINMNSNNRNYLNINHNNMNNNLNNNNTNTNSNKPPQLRKLSIPSQTSQLMGKISQAQTQRITQQLMTEQQLTKQLNQIKSLIHQYRDDFNLQQCLHLCDIIKQDLENDLVEIKEGNKQRLRIMENKERQCRGLKQSIGGFSGVDNLVQIMKRLDVSRSTQYLVMQRISGNNNSNGNNNIKNSQNSQNSNNININSMSNVSIMARNR